MAYQIVTDSNADLVPGFAQEHGVVELELTYTIKGQTHYANDPDLSPHAFYQMMREGQMPITAQVNVEEAKSRLRPILEEGKDLLCLLFSSALSGTYNSVRLAVEELLEEFPQRQARVVDTLAASAGQGLLVTYAAEYQAQGLSLQENGDRIQEDLPHLVHLFTVNDLFHLHRGGRVSAAAAVVGSMLQIKPILHVDNQGKLIPIGKTRGRKAALKALVDGMEQRMEGKNPQRFAISHGDCLEDAQWVAEEVCRRFGIQEHTIAFVGPTIGAHSGPGTVALFFYGTHR